MLVYVTVDLKETRHTHDGLYGLSSEVLRFPSPTDSSSEYRPNLNIASRGSSVFDESGVSSSQGLSSYDFYLRLLWVGLCIIIIDNLSCIKVTIVHVLFCLQIQLKARFSVTILAARSILSYHRVSSIKLRKISEILWIYIDTFESCRRL